MNRIYKFAILVAAGLILAVLTWFITGRPLYWTKGIVIADSCKPVLEDYVCEIELVPDGLHVTAQSSSEIAGGTWVELRAWENIFSGSSTYTVLEKAD